MKIVVVGDIVVTNDLFVSALESLKTNEKLEVVQLKWGPKDRLEFQRKAMNLEKNGPEAEEPPNEIWEHIEDTDVLLTHFSPVSKRLIEKGHNLKLIGTCRGGMEHIDVKAATGKNIPVIHCIRNAEATSDFAIGLMFAETRNIARSHAALKEGVWRKDYINNNYTTTFNEMTLGIVGLGHIGKLVAKKAYGLGMKIIAYDPYIDETVLNDYSFEVELVDKKTLFKHSDIISIHLRATSETENSINKEVLNLMKPNSYLINTSRAAVINKNDLLDALNNRTIGGAALDVFWQEPLEEKDPILELDNVTLTSHNAGNVVDALPKSPKLLVNEINDYWVNGKSDLVVNSKKIKGLDI